MNNRTLMSIGVVALVVFGLFYFISSNSGSKHNWNSTLNHGFSKEPYDLDLCFDLMKTSVGQDNFVQLKKPFSKYDIQGRNNLYVYIGNAYSANEKLTEKIKEFAANGNTVFISTTDFSKNFLESYFLSEFQKSCLPQGNNRVIDFGPEKDSLVFHTRDASFHFNFDERTQFLPNKYFNPGLTQCIQYQYGVDDVSYVNDKDRANCIRIRIGIGQVILHSVPAAFGNDQLKSETGYKYFTHLFKDVHFSKIYLDELRFSEALTPRMVNSEGSMDHVWGNKSMRFMLYVILGMMFLLLLFNAKRKFSPIPVIKPLENTSISFSKTISRLYWLKPNHKNMSELKMKMFLFEVRSRYGLSTEVINDVFAERLARKSGIAERKVQKLVETYRVIHQNESVHEDLLIQLNELIQFIRKHWK